MSGPTCGASSERHVDGVRPAQTDDFGEPAMSDLYLVYVRGPMPDTKDGFDAVELEQDLYLVRTDQTRSQLYHSIKRRLAPERLLVAPLAGLPKFKGMKPGVTRKVGMLGGA